MHKFSALAFCFTLVAGAATSQAQAESTQGDSTTTESTTTAANVSTEVKTAPKAPGYAPSLTRLWHGMYIAMPMRIGGNAEANSSFTLDRYGTDSEQTTSFGPLVRLGVKFSTLKKLKRFTLQAEFEEDAVAGTGAQSDAMTDEGQLEDADLSTKLRKLYAVLSFDNRVWLGAGAMTSHWGMGLVSNDGDQHWQPGSARFVSPRGADRALRAFAVVGLHEGLGMTLTMAAERVLEDDALLLESDRLRGNLAPVVEDDSARQLVGALKVGERKTSSGGIYVAYRDQESEDGNSTKVLAVDLTAKTAIEVTGGRLELEGEVALIRGDTKWAPTMDFDEHSVRQLGIAARAAYHTPHKLGAVADFLYASGDQNFDDKSQTGFKTDEDFEMGMILFRQVLASQTARAVATASDLNLVGEPSEDIERFATRGSATNTVAFFPRAYYRPLTGLEVYGGPMVAFTPVKSADPLNSRLAGGTARNALDAKPGNYLGTELDLGLRYRTIMAGTELTLGLEGGLFIPGSAFENSMGQGLGNVYGARAMLGYRL